MPAPKKRTEELARPRERKGTPATTQDVTPGTLRPVTVPHADGDWHAGAKKIYSSLRTSGQADFYQDSDWGMAWFLCGEISEYLNAGKKSAMMLQTLLSGLERLMPTEADRRKARIELQAPVVRVEDAEVVAINRRAARAFEIVQDEDD